MTNPSDVKNPLLEAGEHQRELTPEQVRFRDEVANWLSVYPWEKVWTVTYDRMEERTSQNYTSRNGYVKGHGWTGGGHYQGRPEKVGISERNAKRYFESWMHKYYKEYSWFYCVEPNPSRAGHHVHALLTSPTGEKCSHTALGTKWWDRYGWNKVEDIKSNKDVTGYCTKHVVRYLNKGGGWYNLEINDSDIYHGRKRVLSDETKRGESGHP